MRVMTLAMPGYIGMEAGKTFLQSQAMSASHNPHPTHNDRLRLTTPLVCTRQ